MRLLGQIRANQPGLLPKMVGRGMAVLNFSELICCGETSIPKCVDIYDAPPARFVRRGERLHWDRP